MAAPDSPRDFSHEIAIAQAVYDAFTAGDIEAGLQHMTDDVVLDVEATGRLAGRFEPYRGHDGIRDYFADTQRVWDDLTITPESFAPSADGIVIRGLAEGRIGPQAIRAQIMWTWTFRDGLVASIHSGGIGEVRSA
ncbi:MAG: nuclear transport factor 2 family protein [Solirubrobacteraceae bacterium]